MTDLSIIVVSYKGWDRLEKCLEALSHFKGNRFTYEVIVVDNNSNDQKIYDFEKKYLGFQFIHNTVNGGYANGNNTGCRKASGEFLLILNPDTIAGEEEVHKLLDAARSHPELSVVSCKQQNDKGRITNVTGEFPVFRNLTGFQRTISGYFTDKRKSRQNHIDQEIIFPDWISGSVVMIKKDLYMKLDGFYEGFWMYYEDVDLCKRVRDMGGIVAYFPGINIQHNHGGSSRINLRTTSITKTEVFISKHIYVSRSMKDPGKSLIQLFLVVNNLFTAALMSLPGTFLFFIPKLFVRTIIFFRLISYYSTALRRRSWLSKRSVLYKY